MTCKLVQLLFDSWLKTVSPGVKDKAILSAFKVSKKSKSECVHVQCFSKIT